MVQFIDKDDIKLFEITARKNEGCPRIVAWKNNLAWDIEVSRYKKKIKLFTTLTNRVYMRDLGCTGRDGNRKGKEQFYIDLTIGEAKRLMNELEKVLKKIKKLKGRKKYGRKINVAKNR